ncbi:phage-related protein [Xanthomonas arboricola]|uniref:type II toxin-antitoxin system RelE/ParE family toxin n=1 Tax=Xanthomonas sp. 3793 TaxID=3035312 RepID=UPI00216744B8|nr:type II toxin-antitoxin system RelE/ParE family toxin [Xanthomonas sp. 3793]MCS3745809.1 phage-related protein [Xanthomonas sp. 3793]
MKENAEKIEAQFVPLELVFVDSTLKDLKKLPKDKRTQIGNSLTAVQHGRAPFLQFAHLHLPKGMSAIELKINGSPGFRCVYTTKVAGKLHVVYVGKKTTDGTDRQLIELVIKRVRKLS